MSEKQRPSPEAEQFRQAVEGPRRKITVPHEVFEELKKNISDYDRAQQKRSSVTPENEEARPVAENKN